MICQELPVDPLFCITGQLIDLLTAAKSMDVSRNIDICGLQEFVLVSQQFFQLKNHDSGWLGIVYVYVIEYQPSL